MIQLFRLFRLLSEVDTNLYKTTIEGHKLKKNKIIFSIAILIISNSSFAQWQTSSLVNKFTGAELSHQYSISSETENNKNYFQTLSYINDEHEEVNDFFNRDQSYSGLNFTSFNTLAKDKYLHFSTDVSRNEQHASTNFALGSWEFGFSAGKGQQFIKTRQSFNGIDPYVIHGGSPAEFNYYSGNVGLKINTGNSLFLGSSTIETNKLANRKTDFIGLNGKHVSATFMNFKRGSSNIGKGISMIGEINKVQFGYQQISRNNGAHVKKASINFQPPGVKNGIFGFSVESINNPLYREKDDLSFMLTFSGEFQKPKSPVFQADENEDSREATVRRLNQMSVIGLAVVGGAVIAGSGSSSNDNTVNFTAKNQQDAAFLVLNNINPISVKENREYGGLIVRNQDGSFGSTKPIPGDVSSVRIPDDIAPAFTVPTAFYHTHGGPDPNFDNENFSPQDISIAIATNRDSYLGTPDGSFKFYNVSRGQVKTLGRIAN